MDDQTKILITSSQHRVGSSEEVEPFTFDVKSLLLASREKAYTEEGQRLAEAAKPVDPPKKQ